MYSYFGTSASFLFFILYNLLIENLQTPMLRRHIAERLELWLDCQARP